VQQPKKKTKKETHGSEQHKLLAKIIGSVPGACSGSLVLPLLSSPIVSYFAARRWSTGQRLRYLFLDIKPQRAVETMRATTP